jgi:ABC-type polar amino acid transport system ATPase subunit
LLRCLNLLEPITSGSILFQGEEIARTPRNKAPRSSGFTDASQALAGNAP